MIMHLGWRLLNHCLRWQRRPLQTSWRSQPLRPILLPRPPRRFQRHYELLTQTRRRRFSPIAVLHHPPAWYQSVRTRVTGAATATAPLDTTYLALDLASSSSTLPATSCDEPAAATPSLPPLPLRPAPDTAAALPVAAVSLPALPSCHRQPAGVSVQSTQALQYYLVCGTIYVPQAPRAAAVTAQTGRTGGTSSSHTAAATASTK